MPQLIYRIETEDGTGAYNKSWGAHPAEYRRHPTPCQDSKLAKVWTTLGYTAQGEFFFGFETIAQMRAWFYADGWMEMMHEAGLRLAVYWVFKSDDFALGNAQLIFRKRKATFVRAHSLLEYVSAD